MSDRHAIRSAVLPCTATLAVALWLGSLVHMLVSVATLFRAFPKAGSSVAVEAAPVLFHVTERANLFFAIVAIVAGCSWFYVARGKALLWAVGVLVLAAALAIVQAFYISAKMEGLRLAGAGDGETFKGLHGLSSAQYLLQTALVLTAVLLFALSRRARAVQESLRTSPMGQFPE